MFIDMVAGSDSVIDVSSNGSLCLFYSRSFSKTGNRSEESSF